MTRLLLLTADSKLCFKTETRLHPNCPIMSNLKHRLLHPSGALRVLTLENRSSLDKCFTALKHLSNLLSVSGAAQKAKQPSLHWIRKTKSAGSSLTFFKLLPSLQSQVSDKLHSPTSFLATQPDNWKNRSPLSYSVLGIGFKQENNSYKI